MKVSANVLIAIIIFLIAWVIMGPFMKFGANFTGDRYEIPKAGATPSLQQAPQE